MNIITFCIVICLGLITARKTDELNRTDGHKRSSFLLGSPSVLRNLLRGAKQVESPDKYTRIFRKSGDYEAAVNDFQTAELTSVRSFLVSTKNEGMLGHASARPVMLQKHGDGGLPTITITKFQPIYTGNRNVDGRLVYTDKIIYDGIPK